MSYEEETRNRYRDKSEAQSYKKGYEGWCNLSTIRNHLISYCEKRSITAMMEKDVQDTNILDIPCGTGKMTKELKKFGHYVGMDVSIEMIKEIQETKECLFIQADGTKMPLKTGSFDVIVSLRLFHRLPEAVKIEILSEMARISKRKIIFSFIKDNLFSSLLLKTKRLFGIIPEVLIADDIRPYMSFLEEKDFSFVKSLSVHKIFSNQHIFLFQKR